MGCSLTADTACGKTCAYIMEISQPYLSFLDRTDAYRLCHGAAVTTRDQGQAESLTGAAACMLVLTLALYARSSRSSLHSASAPRAARHRGRRARLLKAQRQSPASPTSRRTLPPAAEPRACSRERLRPSRSTAVCSHLITLKRSHLV